VFGISHLFYPWGFIVQVLALVHFARRRPDTYWLWIILIGGFVGAAAYIVVNVLPDTDLLKEVFSGFGRRSRIEALQMVILDNPSAGNYEDLAELYWDNKEYAKAREAYDHAISARSDSVHSFYHRALCALELKDFAGALPDLEYVVAQDPKHDYHRAAALLAHACAMTGQNERAAALFAEALQYSTLTETLYNYAFFLKLQGRRDEAREWTQKVLNKKRSMPRYMQRREQSWFRKARSLMKELGGS
jgi:hypothetical protein